MNALPAFDSVAVHAAPLAAGTAAEDEWMDRVATTGSAEAHFWHMTAGFSVPRSYSRLPGLNAAIAASAARGWPVHMRRSGGGLVPQGPGLLNVSVIWPSSATPRDTDTVYIDFCARIAQALQQLGLASTTREVEGSFCDGRFNLAVDGRKVVGTAQAWRRIAGQPLTLAHALVFFDADMDGLTAMGNDFEAAAGGDRRYRAETMTSVARAWREANGTASQVPGDLQPSFVGALVKAFARA